VGRTVPGGTINSYSLTRNAWEAFRGVDVKCLRVRLGEDW
jgi:hypothetical protein